MSDTATFAFVVPEHAMMLVRVPGKVAGTVLTLERMVYTVRICEYTDPYSVGRSWCYETWIEAALHLGMYLGDDAADEPGGWIRANVYGEDGFSIRRARIIDGERVIAEDLPE